MDKKIIDFVKKGNEKALTSNGLKMGFFVFWFISFFALIYGIILKGEILLFSFLIISISLIYTIVTLIIGRNPQTFRQRFINNSIGSAFMSIFFLCLTLMLLFIQVSNWFYILFIVCAYIIIQLLFFLITIISIRNGAYSKKKKNTKETRAKEIKLFALIGGIAGVFIVRTFLSDAEQNSVFTVIIICSFTMSVLSSLGNVNFLKWYYIDKYDIDEKSK